jgi:hypothetical protein
MIFSFSDVVMRSGSPKRERAMFAIPAEWSGRDATDAREAGEQGSIAHDPPKLSQSDAKMQWYARHCNKVFHSALGRYFPVWLAGSKRSYFYIVQVDEKVRQLCAQLLRAENPEVMEEVAAQLHTVVDEYVATFKREMPTPCRRLHQNQ